MSINNPHVIQGILALDILCRAIFCTLNIIFILLNAENNKIHSRTVHPFVVTAIGFRARFWLTVCPNTAEAEAETKTEAERRRRRRRRQRVYILKIIIVRSKNGIQKLAKIRFENIAQRGFWCDIISTVVGSEWFGEYGVLRSLDYVDQWFQPLRGVHVALPINIARRTRISNDWMDESGVWIVTDIPGEGR